MVKAILCIKKENGEMQIFNKKEWVAKQHNAFNEYWKFYDIKIPKKLSKYLNIKAKLCTECFLKISKELNK